MAKKIGLEVTKKIGTEIANELVTIGVDKALIPHIESAIKELIAPKIIDTLQNNKNIQTWLQDDANNRKATYQSLILNLAMEMMAVENNKGALRRIAEGIGDRVLSQAGVAGKVYKLLKNANNFEEIVTFTDNFLDKFEKAIEAKAKEMNKEETKDVRGIESNQGKLNVFWLPIKIKIKINSEVAHN